MKLSAFQLSCGYIQQNSSKRVKLYREHTVYHVRAFDAEGNRLAWDSFPTAKKAQERFRYYSYLDKVGFTQCGPNGGAL